MTDDEKLALIQKRFPEIVSRLNKEKETDYGNVTPREKLFFKDVFETLSRTDKKLFLELYQNIATASEQMVAKSRAMENGFGLKKHLAAEYREMFGADADFDKKLAQENVVYRPTVENLYLNYQFLDEVAAAPYKQQAAEILAKIAENPGKANQKLREALEGVSVEFRIFKGEQLDGKCQYQKVCPEDANKTLVVNLSEGCFKEHQQGLGMLMAHELSHFVDGKGRPDGYQGKLPEAQEFFADAAGYRMAKNCGFDIEHYKAENRKLNAPFFNRRMDKIEVLQRNDEALERAFRQRGEAGR